MILLAPQIWRSGHHGNSLIVRLDRAATATTMANPSAGTAIVVATANTAARNFHDLNKLCLLSADLGQPSTGNVAYSRRKDHASSEKFIPSGTRVTQGRSCNRADLHGAPIAPSGVTLRVPIGMYEGVGPSQVGSAGFVCALIVLRGA